MVLFVGDLSNLTLLLEFFCAVPPQKSIDNHVIELALTISFNSKSL